MEHVSDRLVCVVHIMSVSFVILDVQVDSVQTVVQSTHFNNLFLYRERRRLIHDLLLLRHSWFDRPFNDFILGLFLQLLQHLLLLHVYLLLQLLNLHLEFLLHFTIVLIL
jgi:hypothetical protein